LLKPVFGGTGGRPYGDEHIRQRRIVYLRRVRQVNDA
jgi:hypothetical protein